MTVATAVDAAAEVLGDLACRDEPLAPLTTYRVGGAASLFVVARCDADLVRVARARRASGLPVLVVGRGSNLLVADRGFHGIAVSTAGLADEVTVDGTTVTAGSGVSLPVLARRTATAGLTGFEWAVGVPGSVGGAVRMNAGGHGSDMAACLVDVDVVDLDTLCDAPDDEPGDERGAGVAGVRRVPVDALGLAFRTSALRAEQVVLRARLELRAGDRTRSEAEIAEIVRWRRRNQPGGQNCGSVFVNPIPGEMAAGAVIDGSGLRGFAVGGAHVSEKHANFVQAEPGATAADVLAVIDEVRRRVAATTGFVLRTEVRTVGFEERQDPTPVRP
ncbi:MAG: FAD-binding protein [Ilumatobacteraceae bacterium]